jgi:hypothetical protein
MRGAVRSHPLLRNLAKSAIVAVGLAMLGVNLAAYEKVREEGLLGLGLADLFQICVLLGGLTVLLLNETGRRGDPWATGLPVRARTLWDIHARALALAFTSIVLVMAAVALGLAQLLDLVVDGGVLAGASLPGFFVRPWSVLLAVALVLAAWRSPLADPAAAPAWGRFRLLLAAGALATLGLLLLLPPAWAAVPVLGAGWLAMHARAALPPVLTPAETRTAVGTGPGRPGPRGSAVHQLVARQLFKWPLTWILGLPMVLAIGLILGGLTDRVDDADFARFFNLWIAVYLLIAFTGFFLENLGRIDHLPLARGVLLRWLLLPGFAALGGGTLLGAVIADGRERPAARFVLDGGDAASRAGLRVPPHLWVPVWGDPPARVVAPWGESVAPQTVDVVEGLPLRLWKPYTTAPGSSAEFVAWQIARAAARLHGTEIPPDTIRMRYLIADADGPVTARAGGLTLVADGLARPQGRLGPVAPLLLGPVILATLLVTWSIFRLCGPGASLRRVRTVFWGHMIGLMALHLAGYALLMTRTANEWAVGGLVRGWAAALGRLGVVGWILPWLVLVLLAAGGWRLCARAFARVEAVRPPSSSCGW